MNNIMFSVIIITYNQEKYIAQTLESILKQDHNYSYEIIIGEDCSKDKTKQVIEKYVLEYPNIIKPIYNEHNLGLIGNYYNVLSKCNGKYIMECAGDDFWLPEKVKVQISYMENHPEIGMCYGKAKILNEEKNKFNKKNINYQINSFEDLLNDNRIIAPTICIRKNNVSDYLTKINPIDKNWLMEDYPMWLWFFYTSKVKYLPFYFVTYREFSNSLSHSTNYQKSMLINNSYYDIKYFFADYTGIGNKEQITNKKMYTNAILALNNQNIDIFIQYINKWIPITIFDKIKKFILSNSFLRMLYLLKKKK